MFSVVKLYDGQVLDSNTPLFTSPDFPKAQAWVLKFGRKHMDGMLKEVAILDDKTGRLVSHAVPTIKKKAK